MEALPEHEGGALRSRYAPIMERLFRALGIRGPLPEDLAWQSQLGVTLLDLTKPEYAWLGREARYVGTMQQAAIVGNNSVVIISNPGTQLVTLELVRIYNRNAGSLIVGWNTDTATAGVAATRFMGLDTRQDISTTLAPRPTVQLFTNAAVVAFPATSPSIQMNSGTTEDIAAPAHPIVLRPGTTLWIQTAATNIQLDVGVWWRERAPSDSELS